MSEGYPPKFEEFWKAYPRKVSKLQALMAWNKTGAEDDMYLAKAATDDVRKRTRLGWWSKDKSKIPHPATWIRAQRWHDEDWEDDIDPTERRPATPAPTTPKIHEPMLPWELRVLNRIAVSYMIVAGGLEEPDKLVNLRDKFLSKIAPPLLEELRAETMSRQDVARELGALFVAHADQLFGLNLAKRLQFEVLKAAA